MLSEMTLIKGLQHMILTKTKHLLEALNLKWISNK